MAYKRKSPAPIIEGNTNTSSFPSGNGVVYYNGTNLSDTTSGISGQVLTSNGAGVAPSFQDNFISGKDIFGLGFTPIDGGSANKLSVPAGISWRGPFARVAGTQSQTQFIVPVAGTIATMYVYISSNGSTINTTLTLNVNSVNSALVVTIPALTTGIFTNLVNTVAVSQADLIQFEGSQSATDNVVGTVSLVFST